MQKISLADTPQTKAEKEATKKRLLRNEQAPSTRQQSYTYEFFQEQIKILGNPYDVTHIPISVLEQMQRDPMIAFGLHFIHVPLMRARWHIKCERADIAAFLDNALRRILARYIQQRSQAMCFGFAPIVKRFELINPNWTYIDPDKSDKEIPVWDQGNVQALVWKPFVVLPSNPNKVQPRWDKRNGEFNGIKYEGGTNPAPFAAFENKEGKKIIDVEHSLWVTNEKDSAMGSLWGYPRIGYAYRYWWSYWFRWALYDRFFERKSDPPLVIYYPVGGSGDYTDEDDPRSMKEIALGTAEQARAGGVVALPGSTVAGFDDRPTSIREWELREMEVRGDMQHFIDTFEYLDVMKLRSLWIPEQALIEGSGGTSSRNVASAEITLSKEAAGALADEIDDEINRFIIPDLLAANYPEFDGEAIKITTGFTEADQEVMQQAFQWASQTDPTALRNLDVRELGNRLGLPQITLAEIRRQEEEARKALEESTPPVIEPDQEGNAAVNEEGFYVQNDIIRLSDLNLEDSDNFFGTLPGTKHYSDKTVIKDAKKLKSTWKSFYKEIYEDFAKHVAKSNLDDHIFIQQLNLDAKLVPNKPGVKNWVEEMGHLPKYIADIAGDLISERGMSTSRAIATAVNKVKQWCRGGDNVKPDTRAKACKALAQWNKMKAQANMSLAEDDPEEIANRIVDNWNLSRNKIDSLLNESTRSVKDVLSRAGEVELKKAGLTPEWETDTDVVANYLDERGLEFVKAIDDTVRDELRTFLANAIREGITQDELADQVREHFIDFPDWKANRIVRSEIRNAYNFGTLAAGEQAGITQVQAKDAQLGDTDQICIERNGRIFNIADALSETSNEHPNGTLEWILLRRNNLSVEYVDKMPNNSEALGYFDDENNIIYLRNDLADDVEAQYLLQLGESLSKQHV